MIQVWKFQEQSVAMKTKEWLDVWLVHPTDITREDEQVINSSH